MFGEIIQRVQDSLIRGRIDGWLIYDFQRRNTQAMQFLVIDPSAHLTRRFFYWIPLKGTPIKIVHKIEPDFLDHLPGDKFTYFTWHDLELLLGRILLGSQTVAMEYSPRCAIPSVSLVDAGVVDLVRSFGCQVMSSASLIQYFTSILNESQVESHKAAAKVLDQLAGDVWRLIADRLKKEQSVSEYEVQQFINSEFSLLGYESEGDPICAVNAHSSNPHYTPRPEYNQKISKGDFILIDLWCKKKLSYAVYADITRVAVAASQATDRQSNIFSIVRRAQKETTNFIEHEYLSGRHVRGCDADRMARNVIDQAGYGKYFIHRTGHNIYTQAHGPGAHLDSLETLDERSLLPGSCFSMEPGIYLPDEFGVRLEHDVYISGDGVVEITGGVQESIELLL